MAKKEQQIALIRPEHEQPAKRGESKQWRPGHWKPGKITRYMRHVYRRAGGDCREFLGKSEGDAIGAELTRDYKERLSVVRLKLAGVKLIGDT
jgi:hypothetical protein